MSFDIIVIFDDDIQMRYPGGKGKCYQHIINLMPPHRTYIESHLGGGAVMEHKVAAEKNIGIDLDPDVVSIWRERNSPSFEVIEGDALYFLKEFPYTGTELIYADPPYLPQTRKRKRVYRHDYTYEQHVALLTLLRTLPCMVMVSGYDSPLYDALLSGWSKISFSAKTHADVQEECVWMNFTQPEQLHDGRFVGATYRERQTIQRRRSRLQRRIEVMDPVERHELIKWISTTYPMGER